MNDFKVAVVNPDGTTHRAHYSADWEAVKAFFGGGELAVHNLKARGSARAFVVTAQLDKEQPTNPYASQYLLLYGKTPVRFGIRGVAIIYGINKKNEVCDCPEWVFDDFWVSEAKADGLAYARGDF